ncbi:MAG: RagB/SusD family nutrient uptake outer membrane protein [Saprospiraceae bacterium]|nr:RagB/SusD family nutrient uptake outer membrane protein [Saprospiraceae bacterium]
MKVLKLCLFLFLTASFSACNLLDEPSPSDLPAAEAIEDGGSAEAALIGIYSSMQQKGYYGGQYPLIGEALGGDAATGGYQVISLDEIGNKAVTPANVLTEDLWLSIYRVVANCNGLLTALPNVSDLTPTRKKDIEAQARAIRAMAHFDLLRYFGEHWSTSSTFGVPIITTVQTIDDRPSRATVGAVYKVVTDELLASLKLLDTQNNTPQYVNVQTVNALLARVYLYQKQGTLASEYATKVINSPNYSLLDTVDYASIYNSRRTKESIFELAFNVQNRSAYNALTYGREGAARPEINFMAAEALGEFFKTTRSQDIRNIMVDFDEKNNDATIVPDGRTQKYRGEDIRDNPAYILRLAEMYLIRAEVKGKTAGLEDINVLREKRGIYLLTPAMVATDDAYRTAILEERRAELNFEGHRYFDLARMRRLKTDIDVDNFRSIVPIPGREIKAAGLTQNPGY